MPNPRLPLDGITVVSIEQAIAAPLCTRQLADLGARVIKVERPDGGDFARHYDDRVNGLSSHFVWTNRGKESLTLNLKDPSAREVLDRLLQCADVFVQNLAPAAATRMNLGFDQLQHQFPKLVVCNISGYGDSGPYAGKKAYDLLVQAEAGFLSVTGTPDSLVKSGISIADIAAGTQAHSAILAALIQRGKTGQGSCIDISMLEAMVEWMGFPLYYAYEGAEPPARSGADHASIYPYGLFNTGDGEVIMLGLQNEREWQSFCEQALDELALTTDARFNTNSQRSANREALKKIIDEKLSRETAQSFCNKLDDCRIAYARVNDLGSVWNHPQLKALERFTEIETSVGTIKSLLPPGKNSTFEPDLKRVPGLGQHTQAILEEFDYSLSEIAALREQKAV